MCNFIPPKPKVGELCG